MDGELPADDFQPLLHAGQAEPGPAHRLVRVKARARVPDRQLDGVAVTVQGDVGVSRRAMFDDILEGFLQHAVETQGDFPWQRFRDVLEVNVNRDSVPSGHLFTEPSRRRFQPQDSNLAG